MSVVYVGLSGGVDSAVSAALLKEQGHTVVGVFIKIWSPEFLECTWQKDRLDAMRVAVSLSIPFKEIDLSKEYNDSVIRSMIAEYKRGVTPNPDVLCNRAIKFGSFLTWALQDGADKVATGHYARIVETETGPALARATDRTKDQTYFLHMLRQTDLGRIMFPVGDFLKSEVRKRARDLQLPVAHKPDSQGLCFVGDVSMHDFLRRFMTLENGPVHTTKGDVIGEHQGAALYTIGQRHGFTVKTSDDQKPWYVARVTIATNTLIATQDISEVQKKHARVSAIHWISGDPSSVPLSAQVRYRGEESTVRIQETVGDMQVIFPEAHILTPGQSIVFYDEHFCKGGAIFL